MKHSTSAKPGKMQFEDVFELIGGMGPYQIILLIFSYITSLLCVETITINFVGGDMEHWCKITELEEVPFDQQKYIAIPYDDDEDDDNDDELIYSNCDYFDLPYSNFTEQDFMSWNRSLQVSNSTRIRSCDQWVYDQSDYLSTMGSEWDTVCGNSWLIELSSSILMAGVLTGAVTSGFVSDRFGRRPTFFIYLTIKAIFNLMTALAPVYTVHVVGKFLVGVGNGGLFVICFVIVMELVGPKHRTWSGVLYQTFFSIGFMIIPGMAYFLRDQRDLQLAYAVPMFVMFFYIFFIPESPRWLLTRGRQHEADKLIRHIAVINNKQLPEDFHIDDIEVEENENHQNGTVIDLFKSPVMRKRTLIIYFHWFTDSLMYYALSLNTGALAGDIYLNTFISGAVEIPANLLALFFMNNRLVGRRLTCSISLILAGLTSLIQIPLILTGNVGTATTVCAQLGKAAVTAGFTGIYIYSSELYPTEVRSSGIGSSSMCARISGIIAPFIGGPLGDVWEALPVLIFGIFGGLSGILTLFLPETLGREMPETIAEAEHFTKGKGKLEEITLNGGMDNKAFDISHEPEDNHSTYL